MHLLLPAVWCHRSGPASAIVSLGIYFPALAADMCCMRMNVEMRVHRSCNAEKHAHLENTYSLDVTDSLSSVIGSLTGEIADLCYQGIQECTGVDLLLLPADKASQLSQRMCHTSGKSTLEAV